MITNNLSLVVIRPIGRSGSIFLQSLFDNHPQILSFPMVFPFYLHWKVFMKTQKPTVTGLINYFINKTHLSYLFTTGMPPGYSSIDAEGNKITSKINKKNFIANLRKQLSRNKFPTRKDFLIYLHIAYANTKGITLNNKKAILLHEHGSYNFEDPNEDFENLKNIITIREPRNSYASFIKYRNKKGSAFATFYNILDLNGWTDAFVNAIIYQRKYKNKIIFVKTEELNENPQKVIKNISKELKIKLHKTLFKSTYDGNELIVNFSSFAKSKKGFDAKGMNENKWNNVCSKREIRIIDSLFREESILFKYRSSIVKRSTLSLLIDILLIDIELLNLRYNSFKQKILYFSTLSPLWMRLCLLRNVFIIHRLYSDEFIEAPLFAIQLFDIVLYKLKLKAFLKITD